MLSAQINDSFLTFGQIFNAEVFRMFVERGQTWLNSGNNISQNMKTKKDLPFLPNQ